MRVVEQAILSTDMALYFRKKNSFLEVANTGEIDWQDAEKKDRKMLKTTQYNVTLLFGHLASMFFCWY